jgi:membrane protease YdiL (CAAX protease family)
MQAEGASEDHSAPSTSRAGGAGPLAVIAAIVVVEALASWLAFQPARAGTKAFWALAIGPTVGIAALAAAWARREGILGDWMRPRAGDATMGILCGGALFGAAYAVSRVVTPPETGTWFLFLYGQLGELDDLRAHAALLLPGIIVAATVEEVVWRGLVQDLLAVRFGSRLAWVLQAVAYAVAFVPTMLTLRPPHGTLNPLLPAAAIGAGLPLGFLARRTGRLPPAIVAHALFDWLLVVMFRLWGPSM